MVPQPSQYDPKAMTEEQRSKVDALRTAISDALEGNPLASAWVTDITLMRYLGARDWCVEKAEKMLRATLEWRAEFKPERLKWADVKEEASTGKMFLLQHTDKTGRHVLVMRPRNENSNSHEKQIENLVYMLETISYLADEDGSVKLTILMDFEGYSLKNAPPLKTSKETLNILQNHYPERLSLSMMYHAPMIFSMFWKAISPFIDPVTKKKVTFIDKGKSEEEAMGAQFDMAAMEPDFGGTGPQAFELNTYTAWMAQLDAARATHTIS